MCPKPLQLVAARCIYVLVVAANLELVIKCMDCCMESMSYYDSLRTTVRTMYSTYYTVPTGTRVRSYTYCKHKVLVLVTYWYYAVPVLSCTMVLMYLYYGSIVFIVRYCSARACTYDFFTMVL